MMLWCVVMVMMVAETVLAQENQFVEVKTISFPEDETFNQIQQKLEGLMLTERQYMDERINQITSEHGDIDQLLNHMETRLEESTNTIVTEVLGPLVTKVEAGLERDRMVEAITGLETRLEEKFEGTEAKLDAVRINITNQLVQGATHENLIQMNSSLSTTIISSISEVTTAIVDLVTVEKLEELLGAELEVVREGCSRCGQQDTLVQVSAAVQDHFSLLDQQLNTPLSSCSQGCEAVKQEVSTVVDERCSVAATLTQSVDSLESDLGDILITLDHIYNFTQPSPQPTTTVAPLPQQSQQVPVQVRPKILCEDSTFVASKFNVCAAAVRFRKCNLLALSYHCCHTCYTAGHLPEDGPWRYLNYPRQINTLQGFQLLRTSYNL